MDELLYAARNFEDAEEPALQKFAGWGAKFRLIALWLLMLLPLAWGVAETLKDIAG
jgi:hypothetical protein